MSKVKYENTIRRREHCTNVFFFQLRTNLKINFVSLSLALDLPLLAKKCVECCRTPLVIASECRLSSVPAQEIQMPSVSNSNKDQKKMNELCSKLTRASYKVQICRTKFQYT